LTIECGPFIKTDNALGALKPQTGSKKISDELFELANYQWEIMSTLGNYQSSGGFMPTWLNYVQGYEGGWAGYL